jgi:hypothetical protein
MPNVELLRRTQKEIHANPESWNQEHWFVQPLFPWRKGRWCGTAACFAGHALLIEGWEPVFNADGGAECITRDGKIGAIKEIARQVLDLPDAWADVLFAGKNDLEDIDRIVDSICAGWE